MSLDSRIGRSMFVMTVVLCGLMRIDAWSNDSFAGAAVAGSATNRETRILAGWKVHIWHELLTNNAKATARALDLLKDQLDEIVRVVPAETVAELQKVPLWFSPEYTNESPKAEYHPSSGWLREHGRDPVMVKGVEFTNVRIFEAESRRMPNFTLHELAHAWHHRVLPDGFDNREIRAAFKNAKTSGKYARVERRHANGKPATLEKAYAMTSPQEYFAETTEAFFSRNDFFPFTRDELREHDPAMFSLLQKLWREKKTEPHE